MKATSAPGLNIALFTEGDSIQLNKGVWIDAPLPLHTVEGRLTLTSGTPITSADVTGATSIYFTPFNGNRVYLYDGTRWKLYSFSEISLALGTVVPYQAYDVFLYDNAGTLTLEALEWNNATITCTSATPAVVTWTAHGLSTGHSITFTNSGGALPAGITANTQYFITKVDANTFKISTTLTNVGAGTFINTTTTGTGTHTGHSPILRATALVLQNGVYLKTGALTRRYLGTFVASTTTATEDSIAKRLLYNAYNRVNRIMKVVEATDSWTYATAAYRAGNNTSVNAIQCVIGLSEDYVEAQLSVLASVGVAAVGVGLDSTTVNSAIIFDDSGGQTSDIKAIYRGYPGVGYHNLVWLEYSRSGTTTFYGDAGVVSLQSGIIGNILS